MVTAEQLQEAYPAQCDGVGETVLAAVLAAASERVGAAIANPKPIVGETADAVDRAVIHQAGAWLDVGDSADLAGWQPGTPINIAGWQTVAGATLAPRAARALRAAGLLTPWGA